MKEKFMAEVLYRMNYLERKDKDMLRNAISIALKDYDLIMKKNEIIVFDMDANYKILERFLISKKVEGCSYRTTKYYGETIRRFLDQLTVPLSECKTDHIRYYLAIRETKDKVSKVTLDNDLRNLKSFFSWMTEEEFIKKNITTKIKKIKGERKKKKAFTEIEIEKLRNGAENKRDKAIIDVLLSTGCRVGGLTGMKRTQLENDEIIITEKGNKQRIAYFNAKAHVSLDEYLKSRDDDNEYMFVSLNKPHNKLNISGVEIVVRELGKKVGITDVHPHRFRRTAATMAKKRGMPIEEIQKMLGHENIETTMLYIAEDENGLKENHKKYMS